MVFEIGHMNFAIISNISWPNIIGDDEAMLELIKFKSHQYTLVGGLEHVFSHILGIITPTD